MLCRRMGCCNFAVKGGICIKHGAKPGARKRCAVADCTNRAVRKGVCWRHGAHLSAKKCTHLGCTNFAVRGGVCVKHGAKINACKMKCNSKETIDAGDKCHAAQLKKLKAEMIDAGNDYDVAHSKKLEAEVCYVKSATFTADNVIDNLLYAEARNCDVLKAAIMDFLVENGHEIMDELCFDDVPGSALKDLLAAVARGKNMKDRDVNEPVNTSDMKSRVVANEANS